MGDRGPMGTCNMYLTYHLHSENHASDRAEWCSVPDFQNNVLELMGPHTPPKKKRKAGQSRPWSGIDPGATLTYLNVWDMYLL